MKKKSFFTVFMIFISAISWAQLEIKPAIGWNISRMSNDPEFAEASGRVGYQFGGSVLIGDKFYVEPGVFWSRISSKLVVKGTSSVNQEFKPDIHGLRIPVMVGYHLLGSRKSMADIRIFAGPSASMVLDVKGDNLDKDDFENITWGGNVGAGVDLLFLFADMGYEFGLSQVYKNDDEKAKNHHFWMNVGIRIKF